MVSKVLEEEIVALTLPQAAEQALWDLQQWTEDHPRGCDCFTCGDSIPDLARSLGIPAPSKPIPTTDEPFDVITGHLRTSN